MLTSAGRQVCHKLSTPALQTPALSCPRVGSRSLSLSAVLRASEEEEKPFVPKRAKFYFDPQKLRRFLQRRKRDEVEEERVRLLKKAIPPLPPGWTSETFIKKLEFDDTHEELFIRAFPTWEQLAVWDSQRTQELGGTLAVHRKELRSKILLYLHGLWPREENGTAMENFQAPPLRNEGNIWTFEDDEKLLELASSFDVDFGNPWLYISWKMQRTVEDVHQRFVEKYYKNQCRSNRCEFLISKSSDPLRVSRKFPLDPPFLYIIPSPQNFQLVPNLWQLPTPFQKYRHADCFYQGERPPTSGWEVTENLASLSSAAHRVRGRRQKKNSKFNSAGRKWQEILHRNLPKLWS